jgi:hypothetical protein
MRWRGGGFVAMWLCYFPERSETGKEGGVCFAGREITICLFVCVRVGDECGFVSE